MAPNEQSDPGRFRRERERSGRVPFRTQIFQGVGALPDTFKTFAINTFLRYPKSYLRLFAGRCSSRCWWTR